MSQGPTIGHIGVLTSGGDSPGMNAAVRATVRQAALCGLRVSGVLGGYDGLVNDNVRAMGPRDVSNIIQRGGTMLHSARSEAFLTVEGRKQAFATMQRHGMDALVAIGGDGTFTGANIFFKEHGVPVIGLPGTIDDDLVGTDHTIGYDTAVNTAMEAIDRIRDTASSHDRIFFVEVMGRDTGYIALACAVAAGAEFVLVPERPENINDLIRSIGGADGRKSSSIVVVAEGDEEGGAFSVSRKVKERLPHADIRVTVIGHIQRGGPPTVQDRLLASRLGVAAVDGLLAGERDCMAGLVHGKTVYTPFAKAIGERKELDTDLFRVLTILAS